MRVAVVSDLHGNLAATHAVFADIDQIDGGVDSVVCLGDIVGHASHPNEVIEILRDRDVSAIRGNYDELIIGLRDTPGVDYADKTHELEDLDAVDWTRNQLTEENLRYLKKLPADARVEVTRGGHPTGRIRESEPEAKQVKKGVLSNMLLGNVLTSMGERPQRLRPRRLLFVHGSPRDSIENIYPYAAQSILQTIASRAEADVIAHGHTHQPYERTVGGVTFVGAGSVGWPTMAGLAGFVVIECINFELTAEFRTVEYDAEREARAAELAGLPDGVSELLRRGAPTGIPV